VAAIATLLRVLKTRAYNGHFFLVYNDNNKSTVQIFLCDRLSLTAHSHEVLVSVDVQTNSDDVEIAYL
jgi:hypothetical protein